MNLPELIEWLSKRALAPNLAVYRDGFRQCVDALKSIQPLRDRVRVLEDQIREAKNVMDGCLTYDPMVDKYKLKQYHADSVKPLRDRLAGKESAQPTQPREDWRLRKEVEMLKDLLDNRPDDEQGTLKEQREYARRVKAYEKFSSESAQPVKSEEFPEKEFRQWLDRESFHGPSPDSKTCARWAWSRAARGSDVSGLIQALNFYEGKAIGEIVDGKIRLIEYGETATKALAAHEKREG